MSKLQLKDVSFVYGKGTPFEKTALNNVNASFEADATVGIIGHTGSGKSTLVQLLNGLTKPTSGKVLFEGRDINEDKKELRSLRFKVGLVFQYPEYQLFEETVERDVAYGPKNMGLPDDEVARRVRRAILATGLDESVLEKSPFELSGGQKRRVAIAGVMAMEPEVLVLDEPAAGLDPAGRELILSQIESWREEAHATVIIVSHSMEEIATHCDSILVLSHGEVWKSGTPKEIFSESERLAEQGLEAPQVTRMCDLIRAEGVDLPHDIFTVDAAFDALLPLLKGGADRA